MSARGPVICRRLQVTVEMRLMALPRDLHPGRSWRCWIC